MIEIVQPSLPAQTSLEPLVMAQLTALVAPPEHHRVENSPVRLPPDWAEAVRVAAARLNEKLGIHGGNGAPEIAVMAQELAAYLCAFGKVAEEADRMAAREKNAGNANDPIAPNVPSFDHAPGGGRQRTKRWSSGRIKIRPARGGSKRYARLPGE